MNRRSKVLMSGLCVSLMCGCLAGGEKTVQLAVEMAKKMIEPDVVRLYRTELFRTFLPAGMPDAAKLALARDAAVVLQYRIRGGIRTYEFKGKNGDFGIAAVLETGMVEFPEGKTASEALNHAVKTALEKQLDTAVEKQDMNALSSPAVLLAFFDRPGPRPAAARYLLAGWKNRPEAKEGSVRSQTVRSSFNELPEAYRQALLIAAENMKFVDDFEFFLNRMAE